jgi:hypothetical protein
MVSKVFMQERHLNSGWIFKEDCRMEVTFEVNLISSVKGGEIL